MEVIKNIIIIVIKIMGGEQIKIEVHKIIV